MSKLSKKNSFNKEDLKRLTRNILIMFSPVIILSLEQLQKNEFNIKILYGLIISIIIDGIRRFMREIK